MWMAVQCPALWCLPLFMWILNFLVLNFQNCSCSWRTLKKKKKKKPREKARGCEHCNKPAERTDVWKHQQHLQGFPCFLEEKQEDNWCLVNSEVELKCWACLQQSLGGILIFRPYATYLFCNELKYTMTFFSNLKSYKSIVFSDGGVYRSKLLTCYKCCILGFLLICSIGMDYMWLIIHF